MDNISENRIADALRKEAEKIAKEMIAKHPERRALYENRLATYQPIKDWADK